MFVAQQKKKENIAEYLLYMWQLEDILRAYNFDIEKVEKNLIYPTNNSVEKKQEARDWYVQLIQMMKLEKIETEGHLEINKSMLSELSDLHLQLIKDQNKKEYIEAYYKTLSLIVELRAKSQEKEISEIETCFTALYGFLLLKLQKKDISKDTVSAVSQIAALLRLLSEKYKALSQGGE